MTSQISTDSNSVDSNSAGPHQALGCSATLSHRQRNSAGICSTSLVAGIRKGDRSLEKELLHRYYARVKRQVLHYTRDTWRAEDITHDTLLTILLRLRDTGINQPESLDSFVYQTTKFTYFSWLRQWINRSGCFDELQEQVDSVDTQQSILDGERRHLLFDLVGTMRVERDREILRRSYLLEETKSVVCEALALSPVHFDRTAFRARERLKDHIWQQHQDLIDALRDE